MDKEEEKINIKDARNSKNSIVPIVSPQVLCKESLEVLGGKLSKDKNQTWGNIVKSYRVNYPKVQDGALKQLILKDYTLSKADVVALKRAIQRGEKGEGALSMREKQTASTQSPGKIKSKEKRNYKGYPGFGHDASPSDSSDESELNNMHNEMSAYT